MPLTSCCRGVRVAFRLIDDPSPEDGTDFSSHAAGASPDIARYNCRGVVVAGHTDPFGTRADRSECQTAMRILRPLPRPPDVAVGGNAGVAGADRGRSRPARQNIRLRPNLCERSWSRSDSRTCGQGVAAKKKKNRLATACQIERCLAESLDTLIGVATNTAAMQHEGVWYSTRCHR